MLPLLRVTYVEAACERLHSGPRTELRSRTCGLYTTSVLCVSLLPAWTGGRGRTLKAQSGPLLRRVGAGQDAGKMVYVPINPLLAPACPDWCYAKSSRE